MAEELFGGQDVGATPSYKEQAYRLIKEAILFNRFRVGAIYSQDDICKELGISRTPVREALLELQKDGYVSFSRGKGVQVVPVSDRDARDILETRMYIECINAKLAANRAAQRDLQAMRESLDRLRDQLSTRVGSTCTAWTTSSTGQWRRPLRTACSTGSASCSWTTISGLRSSRCITTPSTPRSSLMSMWPSAMPSRKGAPSGQSRPWPDT